MPWPPHSSTHSPTTPPVIDGVGMRVAASTHKMGLPLTSRREFLVATGPTMTAAAACGLWCVASDARRSPGAPTAVVADGIGQIAVNPYPTHPVALALELDHRAVGLLGLADRQIPCESVGYGYTDGNLSTLKGPR
jgi:hypothetical protein